MRILNYGSLNIDYIYSADHIVASGETILSSGLEIMCGGKGLNQSVALARAGMDVIHAGPLGTDSSMLVQACRDNGISTDCLHPVPVRSGNAVIQLSKKGENSILLYGGANQANTADIIDKVFAHFARGDVVLFQNEVNLLPQMIDKAWEIGMTVILNPSPCDSIIHACDLNKISWLILNEVECEQISGHSNPHDACNLLIEKYPRLHIVLTLGRNGSIYADANTLLTCGIYDVPVVDTTAAGDTFTGYFFASILNGKQPSYALKWASYASGLAVSKKGAVASIPSYAEVKETYKKMSG